MVDILHRMNQEDDDDGVDDGIALARAGGTETHRTTACDRSRDASESESGTWRRKRDEARTNAYGDGGASDAK